MKTFSRLRISSTFPNFSFEEGFAVSYHSQRGIQRRLLQAIFIAKTSKYAESREEAGLRAMPWPPGSMSEPSCSQGSWGTSPPELLLYLPDLTSSQLSFVLLGVGADLTHSWGPGFSIRASTPQGPSCHMVTALLRDQDKVLLLSPVFSHGINTDRFHHHTGKHNAASQAQRGVSSWGVRAGSAVFGSNSSSGFCFLPSSSPPETDAGAQFDFIG